MELDQLIMPGCWLAAFVLGLTARRPPRGSWLGRYLAWARPDAKPEPEPEL